MNKPKPKKGQSRKKRNELYEKSVEERRKKAHEKYKLNQAHANAREELNNSLEILAFTGLFMIEAKTAAGKAKVLDDENLQEIYATYAKDAQALQYLQYSRIKNKFPEIGQKINQAVVKILDELPGEIRELFTTARKQIESGGKEAFLIPPEIIEKLEQKKVQKLTVVKENNEIQAEKD